jgi:hypothetical protein
MKTCGWVGLFVCLFGRVGVCTDPRFLTSARDGVSGQPHALSPHCKEGASGEAYRVLLGPAACSSAQEDQSSPYYPHIYILVFLVVSFHLTSPPMSYTHSSPPQGVYQ